MISNCPICINGVSFEEPIVFCENHKSNSTNYSIKQLKTNKRQKLVEVNSSFFRQNMNLFHYLIKNEYWKNIVLSLKKLRDSGEFSLEDNQNFSDSLFVWAYSILRIFQLDETILYKLPSFKSETSTELINEIDDRLKSEILIFNSSEFQILNFFEFAEVNHTKNILLKTDHKTLYQMLKYFRRIENGKFLYQLKGIQYENGIILSDIDESPRFFTTEFLNNNWDTFKAIYHEIFKTSLEVLNSNDFITCVRFFNNIHTNGIILDLKRNNLYLPIELNHYKSEYLYPSYLGMLININDIKKVDKIEDSYEFGNIISNLGLGFKINNDHFAIPVPYGIYNRLDIFGSRFIKSLEYIKGKQKIDIFSEEIVRFATHLMNGSLNIETIPDGPSITVKNGQDFLSILDKNLSFELNEGSKGEIDVILENNHRIFLIEAKSIRKGKSNREYIREKSPIQCDKYLKFIKEGKLENLIKQKNKNLDNFSHVHIIVVTSDFPDFSYVKSNNTGNLYAVLSTIDLLRFIIGNVTIFENTMVDELVSKFIACFKGELGEFRLAEESKEQVKSILKNYKKQFIEIIRTNWKSSTIKQEEPKFELLNYNSNLVNNYFNNVILGSVDWYFPNEPNWELKEPKLIKEGELSFYLLTQLSVQHKKFFCKNCNIVFLYYYENVMYDKILECFKCKERLSRVPEEIKEKYKYEIFFIPFMFNSRLTLQHHFGDFT